MTDAVVVGGGPAGLMAAEVMASAGLSVTIVDHKPSLARKFLMAGKSGLNLTKDAPEDTFQNAYFSAHPTLHTAIQSFGPRDVSAWAEALGQEVFTGSSGRVFPAAMKASPLLRAWLARLDGLGVTFRTRWRWSGWGDGGAQFDTPEGPQSLPADVTVLALGGGSWSRLGSDGHWTAHFDTSQLAAFAPTNMGIDVQWTDHMAPQYGVPVKNIALSAGTLRSRSEIVVTQKGIEGGGVYAVSPELRAPGQIYIDLMPDVSEAALRDKLARPRGKQSFTNFLRKTTRLEPVKLALLQEFARPLPSDPGQLAKTIKTLEVSHSGPRPIDEAISTGGGIRFDAVDDSLMLRNRPSVFVAGEMLDWDAPTGGYLLTACFATGRWAGKNAVALTQNR